MKVESYSIGMVSQHELERSVQITETQTRAVAAASDTAAATSSADSSVAVTISPQAQQALQQERASALSAPEDLLKGYITQQTYLRKMILEQMLKAITGREIHISLSPFDAEDEKTSSSETGSDLLLTSPVAPSAQAKGSIVTPLAITTRRVAVSERESLSFTAAGRVRTADGREIAFTADLKMRRELRTENVSGSIGAAIDPLVLNFDQQGANLDSEQKFHFDLNSDGVAEDLPAISPGSGFLVLDKNHDGQINNGKELFGPAGGDGLGELADYDRDHNGWIDENDPIFNQLQIWEKDAAGRDRLFLLRDKGVGAIYLGSVKAEFTLETQGQTNGLARRAGLFLNENGSAGTLQQIDFVV